MVLRRIMTGTVAVIVCAFSFSLFGCLWQLNSRAKAMEIKFASEDIKWEMRHHMLEISFEEGKLDRLTLYRRDSA